MAEQQRQKQDFSVSASGAGSVTAASGGTVANRKLKRRSLLLSLGIIAFALVVSFAPLPGTTTTLTIVSGSELQEPLAILAPRFEQENPGVQVDLRFQGSQDIVNNYVDDDNDFTPAVLIPANGQLLNELRDRWLAQNDGEPFAEDPRPIAQTMLVGIAWPERGSALFPSGEFDWQRLEQALTVGSWGDLGGEATWGSFDFVMTNPERSNSGQITLALLAQSKLGSLNANGLNTPPVQELAALTKRSVYNPPRSTDILLQEFIARGPNDADVATVYESIALHRWEEAELSQGQPYQIYYLNPTVETVSTGAIAQRNLDRRTITTARQFLDFLTAPAQQATFVQHGFRPVNPSVDLQTVPDSPWSQNIPGAAIDPPIQRQPAPDSALSQELVRLWQRAN